MLARRKSRFQVVRQVDIPVLKRKPRARILSITHDRSLLRTRELLFKHAGLDVTSSLNTAGAIARCKERPFDLVVVGHSIPLAERRSLVQALHSACASPILALTRPGEAPLTEADYLFDPSETPAQLLATVKLILNERDRRIEIVSITTSNPVSDS
jgi:DNA-binding response OmpR family regulator